MSDFASDAKVLIATPNSFHSCPTEWVRSILELEKPTTWTISLEPRMPLDVNRNQCVQKAIDAGYTHVFFLDYDQVIPADTLRRLWTYNLPVVGSLYFSKNIPHFPIAYLWSGDGTIRPLAEYPIGVCKVDVIGVGCSLWKLDVFEQLAPLSPVDPNTGLRQWFQYEFKGRTYTSEDVAIFRKLSDLGIPANIDTQHTIGHVGYRVFGETEWLIHRESYVKGVEHGISEAKKQLGQVK